MCLLPGIIQAQSSIPTTVTADICIYGGTSAGVIAAYTASKMGKKVILVEPGNRLGGLSSGGLGFTDIGNKYVVTGLARDFYRRIGKHYDKLEQWTFEPRIADSIFNDYLKEEPLKRYITRGLPRSTKIKALLYLSNWKTPMGALQKRRLSKPNNILIVLTRAT